jgi:hypothetical protein
MRMSLAAAAAALLVALGGCGGGSGSGSAPSSPSAAEPTVTINPSGVDTKQIHISQGSRVLFVNHDTTSHLMASDPHPEHTDCPEINNVGLLQPGESRETGNLNTVRSCGFHDHDDPAPGGSRWTGQIVIQ